MSKIILLNGPKECGKNVAVDVIKAYSMHEVVDRRVKDHLFTLTASLFKMTMEEFNIHYEDRETKETPKGVFSISADEFNRLVPVIGGVYVTPLVKEFRKNMIALSVREALIYVSEVVCKPAFGRDYFGKARAEAIEDYELAIDDSCGFDDEIAPTIEKLGMENVMLIRIFGRGSFEGDSRAYISEGVVDNTVDVWNTGTEAEFIRVITTRMLDFYWGGADG